MAYLGVVPGTAAAVCNEKTGYDRGGTDHCADKDLCQSDFK